MIEDELCWCCGQHWVNQGFRFGPICRCGQRILCKVCNRCSVDCICSAEDKKERRKAEKELKKNPPAEEPLAEHILDRLRRYKDYTVWIGPAYSATQLSQVDDFL